MLIKESTSRCKGAYWESFVVKPKGLCACSLSLITNYATFIKHIKRIKQKTELIQCMYNNNEENKWHSI
jgi:hypothetical protein